MSAERGAPMVLHMTSGTLLEMLPPPGTTHPEHPEVLALYRIARSISRAWLEDEYASKFSTITMGTECILLRYLSVEWISFPDWWNRRFFENDVDWYWPGAPAPSLEVTEG